MATEGVNPTSATAEHHTITFSTMAYDDSLATHCGIIPREPYPDYALVRFEGFGNGTVPVSDRAATYIAIVGAWLNPTLVNGSEFVVVQIKRVVDSTWTNVLVEGQYDINNWPTSWRRINVQSIIGSNPLSDYHIRVGFYNGSSYS